MQIAGSVEVDGGLYVGNAVPWAISVGIDLLRNFKVSVLVVRTRMEKAWELMVLAYIGGILFVEVAVSFVCPFPFQIAVSHLSKTEIAKSHRQAFPHAAVSRAAFAGCFVFLVRLALNLSTVFFAQSERGSFSTRLRRSTQTDGIFWFVGKKGNCFMWSV